MASPEVSDTDAMSLQRYNNPMDEDSEEEGFPVETEGVAGKSGPSQVTIDRRRESFESVDDSKMPIVELDNFVEEQLARQEALLARNETVLYHNHIETESDRQLAKVTLYFVLPCFVVALLGLLIGIAVETDGDDIDDMMVAGFVGAVGVSTLSFLACMFIIATHFMYPESWSERRQLMMLSSWAGMVHYMCILYGVYDREDGCSKSITMLDQTSFLSQMLWQISVAHSVFRYIQYQSPAMTSDQISLRHMVCWGVPIFITLFLFFVDYTAMNKDSFEENVLFDNNATVQSPWCGIKGKSEIRGLKALFVHLPQLIGVVLYGFFYYYIALGSVTIGDGNTYELGEGRISTSARQALMTSSTSKRMLDVARVATTLRHCMAAFMMAYLLQTLACVYAEHFQSKETSNAQVVYLARIYLVTPQQLLYAFLFSSTRFGCSKRSVSDDEVVGAPTAIITNGEDGEVLAEVNTAANAIVLDAQVKNAANADEIQIVIKSKKSGQWKKIFRKLLQAVLLVPVSFFVWVPVEYLRDNFTRRLGSQLVAAIGFVMLLMFPFIFFQGTRDTEEQESLSALVIDFYILTVVAITWFGVYRIRNDPALLVVDDPHDTVRWKPAVVALRSFVSYGALFIEFGQIPMLAYSAARLSARYATRNRPRVFTFDLDYFLDMTVRWTFDDLFRVQYPIAVLGIIFWILLQSLTQAYQQVYLKSIDTIIPKDITQLLFYGLSGPGFIFISKNLMKPLFCIPTHTETGEIAANLQYLYGVNETYYGQNDTVTHILPAAKYVECWSETHLTYCTLSLSCLCFYFPTAALTKAQFYLPEEDIRFVYYFQRIELALKSVMIYVALCFQNNSMFALTLLIFSSCILCVVIKIMQPSNMAFMNRMKLNIHYTSIWMCLTCMWAIIFDNQDRWLHAAIVVIGWIVMVAAHCVMERTMYAQDKDMVYLEPTVENVQACKLQILAHQKAVISPLTLAGKRISWGTHWEILRLLQFAKSDHIEVKKASFETLAVLAYVDQMTKKSSFTAYAPSTAMVVLCTAIAETEDDGIRSSAIRTLKTFLQQKRYIAEMADLLNSELEIAEPVAKIVETSTQLPAQLDAGICLLEICTIDSNQLKWVVKLLPIFNEWIDGGSLVAQHLALELIAKLSSRFDLAENIVTQNSMPAIFDLFNAIEASNGDKLEPNTTSGFRKGLEQPSLISNLAHQLPKNVIKHFASQFRNSKTLLAAMGDKTITADPVTSTDGEEQPDPTGITESDFVAWMKAGNDLSDKIKAKVAADAIEGLAKYEPTEDEAMKEAGFVPKRQIKALFAHIEGGEPLQDEGRVADFCVANGLGKRAEILQILVDTGLRPRGMEEMFALDESILPDRFGKWLRIGASSTGLAKQVIETCFKDNDEGPVTDEMIDELFSYIDVESNGSVELSAIASFLDGEGLGKEADIYKSLKADMVDRALTDTLVQLSANHIGIMKDDMIQFVLHIVMECGGGMSGLARQKMIDNGALDIITWSLTEDSSEQLQVIALQGLHALLGDCFSLEDVMADSEFKGYYADCLQLVDETAAAIERNKAKLAVPAAGAKSKSTKSAPAPTQDTKTETEKPVLVFENLSVLQRRKVHMVAQFAGLDHISSGPPGERHVVVTPAQTDAEFLKRRSSGAMTRFGSVPQELQPEPDPEPESETDKKKKRSRWKLGRKKKSSKKKPTAIAAPGVDPWAQEHYDKNRENLMAAGIVASLCTVVTDQRSDDVKFNALDDLLLLIEHGCVPELELAQIMEVCRSILQHDNIGVAVMGAFNLDAMISLPSKAHLFEKPVEPLARFRRAGRLVMNALSFGAGVKDDELDSQLKRARVALR